MLILGYHPSFFAWISPGVEDGGIMSERRLIPDDFFKARISEEEAIGALESVLEGLANRPALLGELVAVANRSHPGSVAMVAAAQANMDGLSDRERVRAGFLTVAVVQCCDQSQRHAAIRAIGRFLPDADAFDLLWEQATAVRSGDRGIAIRAIADGLPNHATELLAAYRASYAIRSVGGTSEKFVENTLPKTAAASALILGIRQCHPDLRAEIRNTIRFRYDGPTDCEYKYSRHPDCLARNDVIAFLANPFKEKGWGDPALATRIRAAIDEHFLEDFLQAFADHGSVLTEAVRLAAAWRDDARVIDAFAGYLEAWGGTFLSEDVTKQILYVCGLKDAAVTERLIRAVDLLERKPMDAPWKGMDEDARPPWTHVGEWTAREIRDAISRWRIARAADIAALRRS